MTTRNFSVKNGITVGVANIDAATGNILTTGLANVGSLAVTGVSNLGAVGNVTITGGSSGYYLQTNGSGTLTWAAVPTGTGISNGTSNINIPVSGGNVNTSVGGVANVLVVTTTGANIAGTLNVTGNANAGNIGAAQGIFTTSANIPLINSGNSNITLTANGNVSTFITGNTTAQFVVAATGVNVAGYANIVGNANVGGNANIGGTLNVTGNANTGNLGTATGIFTTAANTPLINSGNSNITLTSNSNISTFIGGNATAQFVVASTGVNVAGYANIVGNANVGGTLSVVGNANVGNLGTAQVLASANVTAPQLISNIATGTAPLVVSSTTIVTNLNADLLDGYNTATNATANTVAVRDVSGNLTANFFIGNGSQLTGITASQVSGIANGNSNVNIPAANGNVNISASGNANILVVTGTGANIAGTANVTGNANVGNLGTTGLITATGNVTGGNLVTAGILNVTGTSVSQMFGNLNMNSKWVVGLSDPSNPQDAATKAYVDNIATTGISFHTAVAAATTTTLAIATSGTTAYNSPSGAANGIGAYISTTGTFNLIDTANVQTVGTRILVKDEANSAWNGVYTYANTTAIVRSTDTDEYGADSTAALSVNDYFFVSGGQTNKNTSWIVSSPSGTIIFGTSNILFSQFSSIQTYSANTGLTLNPDNSFSISNTSVAAGTYGNGDRVATFTVNSQGQLTAASNTVIAANAANLTGTTLNASVVTSSLTSVGTLGSLTVTGNTTSGNFVGRLANGNSNVNIPAANGNVNISAVGNANILVVTGTGANITGTANISGNANVGNLGAAAGVFTGNVTAGNANVTGQLISTIATGTAPLVVTSTTTVANLGATNATAVQTNTSTSTTTYLTAVTSSSNGNSALNIVTGITANMSNNAITATQFVGTHVGNVIANGTSGVVIANNITASGAASGNANVSAVTGNLGIRAIASTYTDNVAAAGTIANAAIHAIGTPTLVASNAITTTNLSTFFIQSAPTAGTNVTATNSYALFVAGGNSYFAGNVTTAGQLVSTVSTGTAPLVVSSTTVVANLNANALQGNTPATANTASTIALRDANGNLSANFFIGNGSQLTGITASQVSGIANGNSNVNIPAANGNVNISAVGNANILVITGTGANITGTANVSGNANVGNLGAAAGVFTANVTAGNVYANSGTIGASLLTGTLTTAAQPNITSLGTLSALTVSGNITAGNVRLNGGISSNRTNVAISGTVVIDQFAPATFRTAKYVISASGDNGYQSVETLLVHDGSNAFITIYGSICSNVSADIIDVTANINGVSGNVSLYATNTGAGANVKVNIVSGYIQI